MPNAGGLDILYALKSGVAPGKGISEVTVGRREPLRRIREQLTAVGSNQRTRVDFVEGDYGDGKSHLLNLIREEALTRAFAVSKFAVDFESTPLHRPKLVLRAVARNLELPDRSGTGLESLLRNLVHSREFRHRAKTLYDRWISPRNYVADPSLSIWPSGLYAAATSSDLVQKISRWLSGEPIPLPALRREISYVCTPPSRMSVTARDLPTILSGLAKSLVVLGYGGLVLIVDELENALAETAAPTYRRNGVAFLAELGRSRAALYVVGAVTPAVTTTLRNDARVGWGSLSDWNPDFRFLLRHLEGDAPMLVQELDSGDLALLAARVVSLHEEAFDWQADAQLADSVVPTLVNHAREQHLPVRSYVRALVQILELCEQYPKLRFD